MSEMLMRSVLEEYGTLTLNALRHYIPDKEPRKHLYDLIPDYPNRGGKYFRPSLALATSNIHGGSLALTLNSAVTLELLHNAFLIHDDVEDESFSRRNKPTMHEYSNKSIAINVGDAMNALAMYPLLKNRELLGPKLTLAIFMEVQHMVIESAEGQALELGWRKDNTSDLDDDDYFRMILKKTCWYTCIHPIRIGAMIGTHGKTDPDLFNRLGYFMGVAFQIQDDVLNLVAEEKKYGKEIGGDITEGKRTLILINLLRRCNKRERKDILHFLSMPIREREAAMGARVMELMHKYESIEYAKKIAKYMAGGALKEFYTHFSKFPSSKDKSFIESIILYMINRDY